MAKRPVSKETPLDRFWRRRGEEIPPLKKQLEDKEKEIRDELDAAEGKCNPCVGDGGMFEQCCKKCGVSFG